MSHTPQHVNPDDPNIKATRDAAEKALQILSEHYENVLVLASTPNPMNGGGTLVIEKSTGDRFARFGMAHMYCMRNEHEEALMVQDDHANGEENE